MHITIMKLLICTFLCLLNVKSLLGWKIETRIVGGLNVSQGDFPFIVSLRVYNSHICGGTILTKKYVLTAAHCVEKWVNKIHNLSVQYGVAEINPKGPNVLKVRRVEIHQNYNSSSEGLYHDLAIVELDNEMVFDAYAQPIELADVDGEIPDLGSVFLLGWGLPYSGGPKLTQLQYTEIATYSDLYCLILEKRFNPNYHFCGGIYGGGAGHCSGDSGGPAIINGKQFGVISWSVKPCASPGNPGIFVRIPTYRMWIYNHTGV